MNIKKVRTTNIKRVHFLVTDAETRRQRPLCNRPNQSMHQEFECTTDAFGVNCYFCLLKMGRGPWSQPLVTYRSNR